ncbi:threonine/serine dehydratase [Ponticoccus sp. SC2-23]|uniref:threonine ammonia-lyase n=1 Tax=Alexandriicola marinus TaxID=2081710 RepID=UPI000FDA1C70|nr:threonine/serine dehydratase [Alexandriicola marinus]MBM1222210.1 threonine/serine dehydratase [Ponticoccus sp. SC6-9]MBM1226897.1 threonine/serine dehydratase [Ponticoccus sp. SC6-15]MBM1231157.1 threonine/serine dehydratase [Ponticoccus sp. SC6-38]MBM1235591.1 threonine/serine dehydratase [Ponticoccus sp. SC6-45]MBM1240179.1 threonine/serine dehydratase [Ponticoccus sp. SC6-49]MBM1244533.1 threonine/serine dehydratase [Ponticoccus sp. SC2-64]MBM1249065.1 threonine/serine dehydratase [Po
MNIDMIRAAAQRLQGHVIETPLLFSPGIDAIAGRRVLIKAEALQVTGSFKARGGWSALSALTPEARKAGIIAFSSGNHAQGVARAAAAYGAPAVIIMPSDAPAAKIDGTRALGAEVVLYDRGSESREQIGDALARERGLTLIKPYDEPEVIAGQGTTGLEIARQAAALGITDGEVLVCCGGGGLTSGIALALEAEAPAMTVRPVEPAGFDDVARSLVSGRIERNDQSTGSICDAVLTPAPGDLTFPIMHRLCGPGLTVTDAEARRAVRAAARHLNLVVEPGGAIALAAALFHGDEIEGDHVIVTASGGNIDTDMFVDILKEEK